MIVTITGADDNVDPADLAALSIKYPFVEWGLLLSQKREGTSRYPTSAWLRQVWKASSGITRFSGHLCGQAARDVMNGEPAWLHSHGFCQRFQINGYEAGARSAVTLRKLSGMGFHGLILQARSAEQLVACAADALFTERASVLYDPSGGRGVGQTEWPDAPRGVRVGFAGGLGPANVDASLLRLLAARGATWIDMESGVRDETDRLDLERVETVLARVETWMRGPSQ